MEIRCCCNPSLCLGDVPLPIGIRTGLVSVETVKGTKVDIEVAELWQPTGQKPLIRLAIKSNEKPNAFFEQIKGYLPPDRTLVTHLSSDYFYNRMGLTLV